MTFNCIRCGERSSTVGSDIPVCVACTNEYGHADGSTHRLVEREPAPKDDGPDISLGPCGCTFVRNYRAIPCLQHRREHIQCVRDDLFNKDFAAQAAKEAREAEARDLWRRTFAARMAIGEPSTFREGSVLGAYGALEAENDADKAADIYRKRFGAP